MEGDQGPPAEGQGPRQGGADEGRRHARRPDQRRAARADAGGVDDLNEQFIESVLSGPRKPKPAAVEQPGSLDAGVWIADRAKGMGLIDRVESFDEMFSRVAGKNERGKQGAVAERFADADG
jgi:hypothetical protein